MYKRQEYEFTGKDAFMPYALIRSNELTSNPCLDNSTEVSYSQLRSRVRTALPHVALPNVICDDGEPATIDEVRRYICSGGSGYTFGNPEGAVWQYERNNRVINRAKWVRPDFEPGKYLERI